MIITGTTVYTNQYKNLVTSCGMQLISTKALPLIIIPARLSLKVEGCNRFRVFQSMCVLTSIVIQTSEILVSIVQSSSATS